MKFDCGRIREEKETPRVTKWHDWFAFLPVRMADHDCRWMETVQRKVGYIGPWTGTFYDVKYREKPPC